jgi:hypothetical protein
MIIDISEGGARLYSDVDVPVTFTLMVFGEGAVARQRAVVIAKLRRAIDDAALMGRSRNTTPRSSPIANGGVQGHLIRVQ